MKLLARPGRMMIVFLLLLAAFGPVQVARGAPQAAGTEPAPTNAPEAVTVWSQQATEQLTAQRLRFAAPSRNEADFRSLAALSEQFETRFRPFLEDARALDRLSETALHDTETELQRVAEVMEALKSRLSERSVDLEERLRVLSEMRTRVRTFREDESATAFPAALEARLDQIAAETNELQRVAEARLNEVVSASNELLAIEAAVIALDGNIAAAKTRRLQDLLTFQHLPLWQISGSSVVRSAQAATRFANQHVPEVLTRFAVDHGARIVLQVVLLVPMLWLVLTLRRFHGADPSTQGQSRALRRPISAALFVVLLATPMWYPEAPSVVLQLATALLIVPMLRLLTLYVDRQLWPQLFVLTALFVVDRFMSAFVLEITVQRVALLLLSLATAATLAWSLVGHIDRHFGIREPRQKWVRFLFHVGIGLSTASVIFNVLGNVNLALVLQSGTLRSLLLAAGLRAAVLLMNEVADLVIQSLSRRGFRSVATHRAALLVSTSRLTTFLSIVTWAYYSSKDLQVASFAWGALSTMLSAEWTIGAVTLSVSRIVAFAIAVWLAIQASRITRAVLEDDVLPKFALPRGVPNAISTIANYTLVMIGVLVGAGILGVSLTSLTLLLGALGVGIGFGLQNIVNNFVSGLILVFERPLQVGDAVEFRQLSGIVTQVGIRASRIRTFSGSEVIVPNGELASNELVNWTLSDRRRRLEATVGAAYGTDPERVKTVLRELLDGDPDVLKQPAPMVVFEAFGESSLDFKVLFWIWDFDQGLVMKDRINTGIALAFKEAGIEIPFPQRDLHLRTPPG